MAPTDISGYKYRPAIMYCRRCSGRQSCIVTVPIYELQDREDFPCPVDVVPYLEASYSCIQSTRESQRQLTDNVLLLMTSLVKAMLCHFNAR